MPWLTPSAISTRAPATPCPSVRCRTTPSSDSRRRLGVRRRGRQGGILAATGRHDTSSISSATIVCRSRRKSISEAVRGVTFAFQPGRTAQCAMRVPERDGGRVTWFCARTAVVSEAEGTGSRSEMPQQRVHFCTRGMPPRNVSRDGGRHTDQAHDRDECGDIGGRDLEQHASSARVPNPAATAPSTTPMPTRDAVRPIAAERMAPADAPSARRIANSCRRWATSSATTLTSPVSASPNATVSEEQEHPHRETPRRHRAADHRVHRHDVVDDRRRIERPHLCLNRADETDRAIRSRAR